MIGVLIIMLIVYVLINMLVWGIDICMLLVIMGSKFIGENLVVLMLKVLVVSVSSGSVVLLCVGLVEVGVGFMWCILK